MFFSSIVGYISEWLGAIGVAWLLSLSPRFRKPVVGFVYARRDGVIALSIYMVVLGFAILWNLTNPAGSTETVRLSPAPVTGLARALLAAVLCLLPFLTALYTRKQPIKAIGWDPKLTSPALQMGFALAFLTIFLRNRVMDVLSGIDQPGVTALLLSLGIALAEETIFRGYIQMRLSWWLGPWRGISLTALLFTLWHLPAWVRGQPVDQVLFIAGLTLAQGLVLGWVMRKSNHVAVPALYRAVSIWLSWMG